MNYCVCMFVCFDCLLLGGFFFFFLRGVFFVFVFGCVEGGGGGCFRCHLDLYFFVIEQLVKHVVVVLTLVE